MKKNEDLKNQPSQKVMTELENLYKSNQFDYLEDKVRKLIENYPRVSILYNILGIALQKKGDFNDKYLADAKQKELNDIKKAKQTNSFWISAINQYYFNKENFKKLENFEQIVNFVNKKDIVNYFNNTFKENFLKGSFLPKVTN